MSEPNVTTKDVALEALPKLKQAADLLSSEEVRRYLVLQVQARRPLLRGAEDVCLLVAMAAHDAGRDPADFASQQFASLHFEKL